MKIRPKTTMIIRIVRMVRTTKGRVTKVECNTLFTLLTDTSIGSHLLHEELSQEDIINLVGAGMAVSWDGSGFVGKHAYVAQFSSI